MIQFERIWRALIQSNKTNYLKSAALTYKLLISKRFRQNMGNMVRKLRFFLSSTIFPAFPSPAGNSKGISIWIGLYYYSNCGRGSRGADSGRKPGEKSTGKFFILNAQGHIFLLPPFEQNCHVKSAEKIVFARIDLYGCIVFFSANFFIILSYLERFHIFISTKCFYHNIFYFFIRKYHKITLTIN